jgi:hypothetical protein
MQVNSVVRVLELELELELELSGMAKTPVYSSL